MPYTVDGKKKNIRLPALSGSWKGGRVMINVIVAAGFIGVLVMKWNFFNKHYKTHK